MTSTFAVAPQQPRPDAAAVAAASVADVEAQIAAGMLRALHDLSDIPVVAKWLSGPLPRHLRRDIPAGVWLGPLDDVAAYARDATTQTVHQFPGPDGPDAHAIGMSPAVFASLRDDPAATTRIRNLAALAQRRFPYPG